MEIKKYILDNGLTILHIPKNTNSVTIQILVKTGSINENKSNNGISHLIEHLLLEGSKNYPSSKKITSEIEKFGGYINAYTAKERTCFYIKILNKHFNKALDVLLDIVQNPLFRKKNIIKEKHVISREIDLILDEPLSYQGLKLTSTLYEGSKVAIPTFGDKKVVSNITRKQLLDYYSRNYTPDNIIISVVGKAQKVKESINSKFKLKSRSKKKSKILQKELKKDKRISEKRSITSSYLAIGYTVPLRTEDESYVFDVIQAILGRGMSSRLYDELRNKRDLAYAVGSSYICEKDYSFFVAYANTERKKLSEAEKIIRNELELKNLTEKELKESKDFIEGNFYLDIESTETLADIIGFWEQNTKAEDIERYISKIKKVSLEDVKRVAKKYFSKPSAVVILEGENQ